MTNAPSSPLPGAVIVDANIAVAIAAKETGREALATAELSSYAAQGYEWYAPGAITTETLYALCQKFHAGLLTLVEYEKAISSLEALISSLLPPPDGDSALIHRAYDIAKSYGCSRSADAVYIALAEELAKTRTTVLLTFDQDLPKQAAKHAPTVTARLLTI